MLLLRTLIGSRLYGLHHEASDHDFYEVYGYDKFRTIHTVTPAVDTREVSLSTFMKEVGRGTPQALEALYSPIKEVNDIPFLCESLRPNIASAQAVYRSIILDYESRGTEKAYRNAWRLWLNVCDLMDYDGRFDPVLECSQVHFINQQVDVGLLPSQVPGWYRRGFGESNEQT